MSTSGATNYMYAELLKQQIVPNDAKCKGIEIAEISAVAYANQAGQGDQNELVMIGDGGFLYYGRILPLDSKNIVEFLEAFELELPEGYRHVDSESIALYCENKEEPCSYLIGVEKGKTSDSGIFRYSRNGALLDLDPFSVKELLPYIGMADEDQHVNAGFEAMSLSRDGQNLVFTTEGNVKAEDENPKIRRIISYNIPEMSIKVYKYVTHEEGFELSDLALLDDTGNHVMVLERKMSHARLYHFRLSRQDHVSFKLNHTWNTTRVYVTDTFHSLKPISLDPEVPIYDDANDRYADNYEGILLTRDMKHILLATDNNESPKERTIFTLLKVDYRPIVDKHRSFNVFAMLLVLLSFGISLLYIRRKVERRKEETSEFYDTILADEDQQSNYRSVELNSRNESHSLEVI